MYSPNRIIKTISLIGACTFVTLSPQVRAVCKQGCLTNENTVLGDDALVNNTTGSSNTGIGFHALFSNTDGFVNTATVLVRSTATPPALQHGHRLSSAL